MKTSSLLLCFALVFSMGCRGGKSKKPPIMVFWRDMAFQDKAKPQSQNDFFSDHRSARPPVPGTVDINGEVDLKAPFLTGKYSNGEHAGEFVTGYPERVALPLTMEYLKQGQDKFNTFCAPCHGQTGVGNGLVGAHALRSPDNKMNQPSNIILLKDKPNGYLFDVITNGKQTMPAYGHQIGADERWSIVAYIRALQRSQSAPLTDFPESQRSTLQ